MLYRAFSLGTLDLLFLSAKQAVNYAAQHSTTPRTHSTPRVTHNATKQTVICTYLNTPQHCLSYSAHKLHDTTRHHIAIIRCDAMRCHAISIARHNVT